MKKVIYLCNLLLLFTFNTAKASDYSWGLDRITNKAGLTGSDYRPPNNQQGTGVTVYIIDSGIRTSHPEFEGRVQPSMEFYQELDHTATKYIVKSRTVTNLDYAFTNGHGTAVGSIIGGKRYGVAKNVTIKPIIIPQAYLQSPTASPDVLQTHPLAAALNYVANVGSVPAVVNMSLITDPSFIGEGSTQIELAISRVINKGISVVTAAGNNGEVQCSLLPASHPNVINVGSTDINDGLSTFSNHGSCVDIYAPGNSVPAASKISDGYAYFTGTSFAAPYVTGILAALLQEHPNYSPSTLKSLIINSSNKGVINGLSNASNNRLAYLQLDNQVTAPSFISFSDVPCTTGEFDINWGSVDDSGIYYEVHLKRNLSDVGLGELLYKGNQTSHRAKLQYSGYVNVRACNSSSCSIELISNTPMVPGAFSCPTIPYPLPIEL